MQSDVSGQLASLGENQDLHIYDALSHGIIFLDAEARIVAWNRWMEQHAFKAQDEVLGKSLGEVFSALLPSFNQAIDAALKHRLSTVLSARFHHAPLPLFCDLSQREQDSRILQSINVTPVPQGQQFHCLIQVKDMSRNAMHELSLKRATLELETLANRAHEQEAQLKNILNNTLDAIIILNPLGRICGFYKSAQAMFGYSEFELLGKPLSVLFPAPYNRRLNLILEKSNQDSALTYMEQSKSLRANGEIFHSEVSINTLFEESDQQFIVTIKDITERHVAQEALYREKEQAQVTLSSIADGVITTDIVGRVNFVNPAALKLTGYQHDELIDHRLDRVLTIQSDREQLPVFECISNGQQVDSVSGDLLITKNGEEMVIHQVASPIHNQVGDIVGAVMILRDVSKSHRLASRLSWQASHDELTQLINRREFERRLEATLSEARHEGSEHCICFMDLDKFKVVNDTCGHVAGDEMLRQLADILRSKIRGADILARLGGDEFAVILKKCGVAPAVNIAEEIRAAIEEFRFGWGNQSFQVGISIGLVSIDASSPETDEVFRAADSACYAAKEAGRNRVHLYSQDDHEISQRRGEAQWILRIQAALEFDRFELYYQPIVPLNKNDGDQVHYEILVRMIGDDGEKIPPGAFIPSAERYQIMASIDRWVIEHLFAWMDQYWDYQVDDVFAINLSGQSLADEKLLYRIKQLFNEYAIQPQRICFEITETAAISNLSKAQLFIDELKQLGCLFALDDFGSGLSSFAYLKSLQVDYLKIDGAFVKDMVEDPIDYAMVESIHNIGSVLNLRTIAEFVENDAILDKLRELGVHFAQGYGVARPAALPQGSGRLYRMDGAS